MSSETQQIPVPPSVTGGPSRLRPVDARLVGWMFALTFLWGFNSVTIRIIVQAMAPLMGAGLRGVVALTALSGYGWLRGESLRYRGSDALHALVIGVLFSLEFLLLYNGARFTSGGHISIFMNTAPLFVAGGAHFLLREERLNALKILGLTAAFAGILLLFSDELYVQQQGFWRGDLLVLAGAVAWAITTLYMKRFLVERFNGFRLLHAQVLVSTPILLASSLLFEPEPWAGINLHTGLLVIFQGLIVVFFSYLMWMNLLRRYPASGMQSFTFLSPVWGVVAGMLLLSESVSLLMVLGMAMIGGGIILVNRPREAAPRADATEPA
ncbi:MAG: DMT family transporter [SAR324 cluster bacterium]|nr:DMT family transporter [SAR324 cluster bacterium]MCZ6843707.1 DMT family transporter [SAR324 cluster bacterium]